MDIGTATVKILPDLSEFQAIIDAIPASGFVVTETIDTKRDSDGMIVRTVKTTSVTKG